MLIKLMKLIFKTNNNLKLHSKMIHNKLLILKPNKIQ